MVNESYVIIFLDTKGKGVGREYRHTASKDKNFSKFGCQNYGLMH